MIYFAAIQFGIGLFLAFAATMLVLVAEGKPQLFPAGFFILGSITALISAVLTAYASFQ